jgi:3-hydroxyacyl-CoA dehydrogenase
VRRRRVAPSHETRRTTEIIFQAAYFGKTVVTYDISDEILAKLPERWEYLKKAYQRDLEDATDAKLEAAVANIRATSDLADAVKDADLVIEAVPERLDIKQSTWKKVGELAPEKTIFATNSSTLLSSDIAEDSGRPNRFLAYHFANEVWKFNTGEVMRHAGTDDDTFDAVVQFATEMGMVPLKIQKEQPGYILNSLLVPFLNAASVLLVRGVATIEDIDKTWRTATGAPTGPFQFYDIVGMMTPYNLNKGSDDPEMRQFAELLKTEYIDKGRMGKGVGHGFYDYE